MGQKLVSELLELPNVLHVLDAMLDPNMPEKQPEKH
jgi:hypothetical protein